MSEQVDLSQLAVNRGPDTSSKGIAPKRRWGSRYVLPLVVLLGFSGLIGWAAKDSLLPAKSVSVVPVVIKKAEVQAAGTPLFQAAGWVEPRPAATVVSSLAPGMIEKLHVVAGQSVQKNDPIATMSDIDARIHLQQMQAEAAIMEAQVDAAQSELEAAKLALQHPTALRTELASAESTLAMVESQLIELPSSIEAARKNEQLARTNVETKRQVRNSVTGPAMRAAESKLADAIAKVQSLQLRQPSLRQQRDALTRKTAALTKQLDLKLDLKSRVASAQATLKSAKAKWNRAKLNVTTAQLQLDRMVITSPINGRIHSIQAIAGMRVVGIDPHSEKGASAVATVYDPGKMQVRVDVRLEDVRKVNIGQKVQIETASTSQPFAGTVISVTSVADIQKNTLQVKVAIDDSPDLISPEMLAQVTFFAPELKRSNDESQQQLKLLVPRELVKKIDGQQVVWVADQGEKQAKRVAITLGRAGTERLVEVVNGLQPTDKLIASGLEDLSNGQRIRVVGEDNRFGVGSLGSNPRSNSN